MLLLEYLLCYLAIDVDKKGKKVEFNQLKGFECDIWTVCARETSGRLLAILCHQHLGNQLDVYVAKTRVTRVCKGRREQLRFYR